MKINTISAFLATMIVSGSFAKGASTYAMDFATYQPNVGANWNTFTTSHNNVLLKDLNTGLTDTAMYSQTGVLGDANFAEGWDSGDADYIKAAADGFYTGSAATITISGLIVGGEYKVSLISAEKSLNSNGTGFPSIVDSFSIVGATGGATNWDTEADGVNSLVEWQSVTTAAGAFTINIDASSWTYTTINALVVTQVPEPSSTMLLGLCGLVLTVRRRR